jgi:hypothetical protein
LNHIKKGPQNITKKETSPRYPRSTWAILPTTRDYLYAATSFLNGLEFREILALTPDHSVPTGGLHCSVRHVGERRELAVLEVLLHVLLEVALVGVGGLADGAQVARALRSCQETK